MRVSIGETIRVTNPDYRIRDYCKKNLEQPNPEYIKKKRMGLWTGNIPKTLVFYEIRGDTWVIPFGCLRNLLPMLGDDVTSTFAPHELVEYEGTDIPLYEYQQTAVNKMITNHYGILQSPAGSGKTQMGIAIAQIMRKRTLWLTHTKDLLIQSKTRAEQYLDPYQLGTITEGKVHIGNTITFATIQTMCRLNLSEYRDMWDVIIVDECHRVAGTPTAVTRFSKVLNSLAARHKFGLSATVHRADGMIKATYALLGDVVYTVPDEAVAERVMQAEVLPRFTGVGLTQKCLNGDGTLNYAGMIGYLTNDVERNKLIRNDLVENRDHYNLILSERVDHLKHLYEMLPDELQEQAVVIDGKTRKNIREQALEDARNGTIRYLFATYPLAKEGLDIPRLDRLFLVTPQKDYAVIVQSVGRIIRTFDGKDSPMVYDYVDAIRSLEKSYKTRCRHYRKRRCTIRG